MGSNGQCLAVVVGGCFNPGTAILSAWHSNSFEVCAHLLKVLPDPIAGCGWLAASGSGPVRHMPWLLWAVYWPQPLRNAHYPLLNNELLVAPAVVAARDCGWRGI
jgi:hypothetical protein